jgi:hypothetical protein
MRDEPMDISLWGGWHVTLFHPWVWLGAAVCVLLFCGYVLKLVVAAVRG